MKQRGLRGGGMGRDVSGKETLISFVCAFICVYVRIGILFCCYRRINLVAASLVSSLIFNWYQRLE